MTFSKPHHLRIVSFVGFPYFLSLSEHRDSCFVGCSFPFRSSLPPFSKRKPTMNFYCMHRQKQRESAIPEKPEMSTRKTPKFKNPKNTFNIQDLAKEHALAYFQKPWDYYLKSDEACATNNRNCATRMNFEDSRIVSRDLNSGCYKKYSYNDTIQLSEKKVQFSSEKTFVQSVPLKMSGNRDVLFTPVVTHLRNVCRCL